MKKILVSILFGLFAFSQVATAAGINVGVSGNMGLFAASAKEVTDEQTRKGTEHGAAAYGSIFLEGQINDRLAFGVEYVPEALETDEVESIRYDKTTTATASAVENKVKLSFEDMTTAYANLYLTDNSYIKAGLVMVDVITKEDLGTGATYGDMSLDGQVVGFGFNNEFGDGLFMRAEANYMTFGSEKVSSGDNTITLTNLDGVTASIKVGKSF